MVSLNYYHEKYCKSYKIDKQILYFSDSNVTEDKPVRKVHEYDFRNWNIPVRPGIMLLGENYLLDTIDEVIGNKFKTDVKHFFIDAKGHWRD